MAQTQTQTLFRIPDKVTGYQLDPNRSFWSVIVPEGTRNLLINPSFELDTTGDGVPDNYSIAGTWVADTLLPSHGINAARGGYDAGNSISQTVNLDAGAYTFSIDLYGYAGRTYELRVIRSAQIVGKLEIKPTYNGYNRYAVSFAANTPGSYTVGLWVTKGDGVANEPNVTDAWQLENKGYATTYADGDMDPTTFRGRREYYWEGEPHLSPSVRIDQSPDGGRIVSFAEAGFLTTTVNGLGLPQPNIVESSLGVSGTRQFAGLTPQPREIGITGHFIGCSFNDLLKQRAVLSDLLTPYAFGTKAPLSLIFQLTDTLGIPIGPPARLRVVYIEGLQGNIDNFIQEELTLRFRMYDPFVESMFGNGTLLNSPADLQDNSGILYRSPDGKWSTLSDIFQYDTNTNLGGFASVVKFDRETGYIYIGGSFYRTTPTGDVIGPGDEYWARNLVRWRPGEQLFGFYNSAWNTVTGTGNIEDIALGRGILKNWRFLVGDFNQATGGGQAAKGIAAWREDGMPGGISAGSFEPGGGFTTGYPRCIESLPDGRLVMGGNMQRNGPDTFDLGGLALWVPDPDMFTNNNVGVMFDLDFGVEIIDPAEDGVYALAVASNEDIYFGGKFILNRNQTLVLNNVGVYRKATGFIEALGTGLDGVVRDMKIGPDGMVYAVGDFNNSGDGLVNMQSLARWNGRSWEGFGPAASLPNRSIEFIDNGRTFTGGGYLGGRRWEGFGFGLARINGNVILPADVGQNREYTSEDPFNIVAIDMDTSANGQLIVGLDEYEDVANRIIATNSITEVVYEGTAPVRPRIVITGPGKPKVVESLTTGSIISFRDDFELGVNEVMTIDLTQNDIVLYSNFRRNLNAFLLPSDFVNFTLLPGVNRISTNIREYIDGSNVGQVSIIYTPRFTGIDFLGTF